MASVVRGKALVAKLRANPKVRDAEALAAWLGRVKKLKRGGLSTKAAMKAAGGKSEPKRSVLADLHDEDTLEEDKPSAEGERQKRHEEAQIRAMEKQERSALYNAIHEAGGIKTREELKEEYAEIPNTFKRKDGMPGDEMADYLKTYYPELGIEDENDLLDFFFNARRSQAA